MIKIIKKRRRFVVLRNEKVKKHLKEKVIALDIEPSKNYYRGKYVKSGIEIKEVPEALAKDSHYKCAYCETFREKPQVEHFRPHGKSNNYIDENRLRYLGHNGYNWLSYEWRNFLPSCPDCNLKKGSYFPINGIRVKTCLRTNGSIIQSRLNLSSNLYDREEALLLNPETDSLEGHFQLSPYGEMTSTTDKGKISKDLYDLNRGDLIKRRLEIIQRHVENFQSYIDFFHAYNDLNRLKSDFKQELNKVKQRQNPKAEFSFVANYIAVNFDNIVKIHLENFTQEVENELENTKNAIFI